MNYTKSTISNHNKILLALGKLIITIVCVYAFLFIELISSYGVSLVITIVTVSAALLVAVFLMPLIYDRINGSISVSTGRYHFVVALSVVCLALFNVILFSLDFENSVAYPTVLFVASYIIVVISLLCLWYVFSSMRTRLITNRDKQFKHASFFARVFGSALFLVLLYFSQALSYDISDIAIIASILVLVMGMSVYFATCSYIPKFIRIQNKTKRNVKERYSRFYGFLLKKVNLFMVFAYLFALIPLFMFSLDTITLNKIFSFNVHFLLIGFIAFAVSYFISNFIIGKVINEKNILKIVIVSCALIIVVSAAVFFHILLQSESADVSAIDALLFVLLMTVMGFCAAAMYHIGKFQARDMINKVPLNSGVIGIFYNIVLVAAFTIAVIISTVIVFIGIFDILIYCIATAFFSIAAIVFGALWVKFKKKEVVEIERSETVEIDVTEILKEKTIEPQAERIIDEKESVDSTDILKAVELCNSQQVADLINDDDSIDESSKEKADTENEQPKEEKKELRELSKDELIRKLFKNDRRRRR